MCDVLCYSDHINYLKVKRFTVSSLLDNVCVKIWLQKYLYKYLMFFSTINYFSRAYIFKDRISNSYCPCLVFPLGSWCCVKEPFRLSRKEIFFSPLLSFYWIGLEFLVFVGLSIFFKKKYFTSGQSCLVEWFSLNLFILAWLWDKFSQIR